MTKHRAPLLVMATLVIATAAAELGCVTTTAFGAAPRPETVGSSPNYDLDGRSFVNSVHTSAGIDLKKIGGVLKRYRQNVQRPTGTIPTAAHDGAAQDPSVQITWVGHSTILIEVDGFRVLTDPVWSKRVSPFQWVGPKRFHEPGIAFEDLGRIDAVIISHDHYDHLDQDTIERLALRQAKFVVPLGVGSHLRKWGVHAVTELDWWQSATLVRQDGSELELVATPARHFSGRSPWDRDRTLWASWVVRTADSAVYFGGDTGYFDGFAEIGRRFGPFDATLIPIGAYDEAWSDIHLNPDEAVQAHLDLGNTGLFVPVHYGTFALAAHDWDEPMERLSEVAIARDVSRYAFPLVGQRVAASRDTLHQTWWRQAR